MACNSACDLVMLLSLQVIRFSARSMNRGGCFCCDIGTLLVCISYRSMVVGLISVGLLLGLLAFRSEHIDGRSWADRPYVG